MDIPTPVPKRTHGGGLIGRVGPQQMRCVLNEVNPDLQVIHWLMYDVTAYSPSLC